MPRLSNDVAADGTPALLHNSLGNVARRSSALPAAGAHRTAFETPQRQNAGARAIIAVGSFPPMFSP